jgi:hypothetical protein
MPTGQPWLRYKKPPGWMPASGREEEEEDLLVEEPRIEAPIEAPVEKIIEKPVERRVDKRRTDRKAYAGQPWLRYEKPLSPDEELARRVKEAEEGGFLASLQEAFTGTKRTTPEIERLPEFGNMAAANALSMPAFRTTMGMLMSFNPEDQIGIIKESFPEAKIETDKNDVTFITIDGEKGVLNKPGWSWQDTTTAIGQALAFGPAAKIASLGAKIAAKMGIGAVAAAATQTAMETAQTLMGGEFNEEDIALAGLFGGAAEGVLPLAKSTWQVAKDPILKSTNAGKKAIEKIARIGKEKAEKLQQSVELDDLGIDPDYWKTLSKDEKIGVLKESQEAAQFGMSREEFKELTPELKQQVAAEKQLLQNKKDDLKMINDIVESARLAEKPGMASEGAKRMAELAEADPKIQAAAGRLNILGELTAAQMTKNPVFRELSMAVQSAQGSQLSAQAARTMQAYGNASKELITDLGSQLDLGAVSAGLQQTMETTVRGMEKQADTLYNNVRNSIGDGTPIQAPALVRYLKNRAGVMGGEEYLQATEKSLLRAFRPESRPTYARLDAYRKRIGAGYKGKDEIFKSADRANLDKWYGLLTQAQETAALRKNILPVFRAAKESVRTRKQVENDMRTLFGNKLQKTLSRTLGPGIKNLKKGHIKEFAQIANKIPQDQRKQVVASSLSEVINVPLNQYMGWYRGLNTNKSARKELMRYLPTEFKQGLQDLYTVGQGIQKASKNAIATGKINDVARAFEAADEVVGNLAKQVVGAGIKSKLGFWTGQATNGLIDRALQKQPTPIRKSVDNLLMDSRFQMFLQKAATNEKEEVLNKAAKSLEKTAAWKKYARYLSKSSKDYINSFGILDFLVRRPARMAKSARLSPEESTFIGGQLAAQQTGEQ